MHARRNVQNPFQGHNILYFCHSTCIDLGWAKVLKVCIDLCSNLISTKVRASHRKSTQVHASSGQTGSQDSRTKFSTCEYVWLQSWTKVLTHLSKTNAFYRRPSVISKSVFFVDSQAPLSPFSLLQYAPWTLSPGYNIEKRRGGRNVKIRH